MINKIKSLTEKYHSQVIDYYHHLHMFPELSFQEYNTSEFIQSELGSLGIEYKSGIAGTGILGIIKGDKGNNKTIAIRADMDALPIREENDVVFRSKTDKVMHACGHDAHTASLLGAARILKELATELNGTVLLIFQPGEEKHPGGARLMLKDGIFDDYTPDMIIAQHVYVDYPSGTVGFEPGVIMAAADEVHMKISGKGGHGALPHLLNDTVLAASQCIVSLQQIVSRRNNPFNPAVLSFGRLIAEGATNVIPDEVTLSGTLRTMNEDNRKILKEMIRNTAIFTAESYGCKCDIEIYDGYPCVFNDPVITTKAKQFAVDYLGEKSVKGLAKRMTAEDFGFFSQKFPSTFYRFGIKGKKDCSGLHTSRFLIDENSLKTSVGLMAFLGFGFLNT